MASVATIIRKKVERSPENRLWTYRDFASLPMSAVASTLSRLADAGVVHRLRKGVYFRPKTTRFGEIKPDAAAAVTRVLDGKKVGWAPTGLNVWNALGLTTQVAAVPTFAVNRRVRLSVPDSRVRFTVAPSLDGLSAEERGALDALRHLRRVPDSTPEAIVARLIDLCREGRLSFVHMTRAAKSEPPRVRALLGLIGTRLGEKPETLDALRRSLNPLTTYKLGLADAFPEAANWNIG